jgi:hypothetical protein
VTDATQQPTTLYVATDLATLEIPVAVDAQASPAYQDDVFADGRFFRRLDPDLYAWLRHKMELARTAFTRGRLPEPAFDALRTRFNAVHTRALALLGESALLHAVQHLDPKSYPVPGTHVELATTDANTSKDALPASATPPDSRCSSEAPSIPGDAVAEDDWSGHQFPEEPGDFRFLQPVRRSALTKVQAIRDAAVAIGWTDARLFQNRGRFLFPCGNDYGLACFVHPDQTIGRVTPRAIEIVCAAGHSLNFYRNGGNP